MSPTTTSPVAGRIVAYDALRVFAIVSVVAIHTLMPYRAVLPGDAPVRVVDDLLHYAVPLFVFISGALLWARRWTGGAGAYSGFIAKRFAAVGVPYLAWAALYSALYVVRAQDAGAALAQLPGLVASGHVWYHLYFIPMLLTFYLLTPVASAAIHRWPELSVFAAYGLRIVLGPGIARALAHVDPLLGQYATHVLSHLPHMVLGAWFALRLASIPTSVRRAWPLMIASGTLVLGYLSAAGSPTLPLQLQRLLHPGGMALTVLGLALGALALEPRYSRWARWITHLGALSFGVYFMHPALLLAVFGATGRAVAGSLWSQWWFPIAVWASVSAVCFGVSDLLGRAPATAWLVASRPRPRVQVHSRNETAEE